MIAWKMVTRAVSRLIAEVRGDRTAPRPVVVLRPGDAVALETRAVPATVTGTLYATGTSRDYSDSGPVQAGDAVTLRTADGVTVASTTTDVNGNFTFTNVPDGDYVILGDGPDLLDSAEHVKEAVSPQFHVADDSPGPGLSGAGTGVKKWLGERNDPDSGVFAPVFVDANVKADPKVQFTNGPSPIPNVGGGIIMDFRWDNCNGIAKIDIQVVEDANPNNNVGSDDFPTTLASSSKQDERIFTTAAAGTKVKVTISALDAAGKVIASKSATVTVK